MVKLKDILGNREPLNLGQKDPLKKMLGSKDPVDIYNDIMAENKKRVEELAKELGIDPLEMDLDSVFLDKEKTETEHGLGAKGVESGHLKWKNKQMNRPQEFIPGVVFDAKSDSRVPVSNKDRALALMLLGLDSNDQLIEGTDSLFPKQEFKDKQLAEFNKKSPEEKQAFMAELADSLDVYRDKAAVAKQNKEPLFMLNTDAFQTLMSLKHTPEFQTFCAKFLGENWEKDVIEKAAKLAQKSADQKEKKDNNASAPVVKAAVSKKLFDR